MTDQSIKVEELREALKIVKGVQSSAREISSTLKGVYTHVTAGLTFDDIMELKDSVHTFKTGDLVSCNWGGSNKIGYIIDPIVRYNGYMKFTKKNSEDAAIVRLLSKSSTGYVYSSHEVVPYREIGKVIELRKGKVIKVDSEYEVTVETTNSKQEKVVRKLFCNFDEKFYEGLEVEVLYSNNKALYNLYVYKPWQEDESKITKLTGYEL